jgi:hypothetical protein
MGNRRAGKRAFVTGAGQGMGRALAVAAMALPPAGGETAFAGGTAIRADAGRTL